MQTLQVFTLLILVHCVASQIAEPIFSDIQLKTLKQKFDGIKKSISVADDERQNKRLEVKEVLDKLIELMKQEEPLFRRMFVELKYTGSYFDNLRIKDANEFDINVVLKLPVRKDKILLNDSYGVFSNYASLEVDFSREDPLVDLDYGMRGRFGGLLNRQRFVQPQKVLNWFQSVMAKACNKLQSSSTKFDISASGPAKTLKIRLPYQTETVDVDLVPVFRYEPRTWNETSVNFRRDIVDDVAEARRRMYLVPKIRGGYEELWRKHFPEVEEELLSRRIAAKPVIRILKLLRDNNGWHSVASYFIKTLVLLEIVEHKWDSSYWNDARLPNLIFSMMVKLGNCFQSGDLPHLLYEDVNLLDNLSRRELDNYFNKMKRDINKCKLDLDYVDELFRPNSGSAKIQKAESTCDSDSLRCNIL